MSPKKSALGIFSVLTLYCLSIAGYVVLIQRIHAPAGQASVSPQSHYRSYLSQSGEVLLWVELGNHGELLSVVQQASGRAHFAVKPEGFEVGSPWYLPSGDYVPWYIRADERGDINAMFPPFDPATSKDNVDTLALFLTDGDSVVRTVHIVSEGEDIIADSYHHGRWVELSVSRDEAVRGLKVVRISSLTGNGATLSAAALLRLGREKKL